MSNNIAYNPRMCDVVIDLMSEGKLPNDVMKAFNIDSDTFLLWQKLYPKFDAAVKKGLSFSEGWWEEQGRLNLCNPGFDFNRWKEVMCGEFGWHE